MKTLLTGVAAFAVLLACGGPAKVDRRAADVLQAAEFRIAGEIASSSTLQFGILDWRLSNGSRVLVMPTQFNADEIQFRAYGSGGVAQATQADRPSALYAAEMVEVSGVGKLDARARAQWSGDRGVSLSAYIRDASDELRGRAVQNGAESLLQLAYATITEPRYEPSEFPDLQLRARSAADRRAKDARAVFSDTVQATMLGGGAGLYMRSPAIASQMNGRVAAEYFRHRFSNASNFTFVLVGAIDTALVRPLVERYLASLPSITNTDRTTVAITPSNDGLVRKRVKGAPSTLRLVFSGECADRAPNRVALWALVDVLRNRVLGTQAKLAVARANVESGCVATPQRRLMISIELEVPAQNLERAAREIVATIDSLQRVGPSPAEALEARAAIRRRLASDMQDNNWWAGYIGGLAQSEEKLSDLLGPLDEIAGRIGSTEIRDAARRHLTLNNYARFELAP